MNDARELLDWMKASGPGDITLRDLSRAAPRRFRQAAAYGPLLAQLANAGAIVETGAKPRAFRIVPKVPASALAPALPSGAEIRRMLADGVADLPDVPAELAAFWSSMELRTVLIARLREAGGLPCRCAVCDTAGQIADAAVMDAFDCARVG